MSGPQDERCPCGTGEVYSSCCGRFHGTFAQSQELTAPTAEALMRSRYAAYALDRSDYVFTSWHPRTRPEDISPVPGLAWVGLEVLDVVDGGPGDETGIVEFRATSRTAAGEQDMHERSRFERRRGRWVYVDGDVG